MSTLLLALFLLIKYMPDIETLNVTPSRCYQVRSEENHLAVTVSFLEGS